jgi:hypothetical protein
MGLDIAPEAGEYEKLQPQAKSTVDQWAANLRIWHTNERKTVLPIGLWVEGPPCSGTTYTASVATKQVVRPSVYDTYGIARWEYITYADLADLIRDSWSAAPRNHTDDMNLFQEAAALDQFLAGLWRSVDLLWVDDLQTVVTDMGFFEKYIFSEIQRRLKRGLPVIVSTSLKPSELGDDLSFVIKKHFLDCVVTR